MGTNLVQPIHACKEPQLKMDFGSPRLGKGDGRTHFVGGSCMEGGRLGAMFPSYITHTQLRHEPPPREGSDSFSERIQQEGAEDPHVTPCLRESLQHIYFFFTGGDGKEEKKMQTVSPTKRKCY